ncbi:hypothetical protein RCIP0097_00021 [Klebsiella phage RCIP0097]
MALYREGKAAMAADGTVTGTGTKWQSSLSLIRPGATIMFLSSPIQMAVVNKVVSDTEIKAITTNGAVVASTDYAILLSDSLTVDGLAQDVAETLRYYQSQETVIADAVEFFKEFDFESLQNLANQIKADSEAAESSAAAAAASESKAKTSEDNAKSSENAAKNSEVAAETTREQIQQIIDNAGDQSTLVVLAQPDGASKSYSKNAPVSLLLRRNIFEYMTEADRNTISATVGVEVVVDYALQAAIDDGVMGLYFPPVPGVYVFGQSLVTLPVGFSFEGKSRRTYTAYSDASFNNVGTVFRLFNGASAIFKLTSRHTFRSVVFDGRNKSVPLMRGDDQTQWCRFYDCGIHRWGVGLGNSSPNGYSATLIVSGGTISSNKVGVRNVIDSLFLGVTINANEENGVELMSGASNNAFIGVRNEWNNGDNYYGYGCKRILIQGELIDRAGKRAVAAVGGAQFILSGVAVQRSGRLATEGSVDDAHYYIEGDGSSIIETAVHTTTGANDDGSGRQSPTYILATGGSSSDGKSFIASASNLSGYAGTSWLRSGYVKGLSVLGCSGVDDVKNFGFRRIDDGVQYLGDSVPSLSLSGAGSTATLTFKTTEKTLLRYSTDFLVRTLEIRARNNTNTGAVAYYSVNLIISREQASAALAVDTASVRTFATLGSGTWGIASASPTGVSLDFAISADGATLTVTLTAIDSASRLINARLRA